MPPAGCPVQPLLSFAEPAVCCCPGACLTRHAPAAAGAGQRDRVLGSACHRPAAPPPQPLAPVRHRTLHGGHPGVAAEASSRNAATTLVYAAWHGGQQQAQVRMLPAMLPCRLASQPSGFWPRSNDVLPAGRRHCGGRGQPAGKRGCRRLPSPAAPRRPHRPCQPSTAAAGHWARAGGRGSAGGTGLACRGAGLLGLPPADLRCASAVRLYPCAGLRPSAAAPPPLPPCRWWWRTSSCTRWAWRR